MGGHDFPLAVVIEAVDKASAPLDRLGGKLVHFSERMEKISHGLLLGFTAPVAAMFTAGTLGALHEEKAMLRLADATGASAKQLEHAAEANKKMAGKFSQPERLDALATISKFGLDLEQSLGALTETTNLAIAAEGDLGEASRLTMGVLRGYGRDIGDVAHVTDILAKANASSNMGLEGFGANLITVAPLAHDVGLEIEDVAASLIALEQAGQNPVAVLRLAIASLVKPSKDGAEALGRLKVDREEIFKSTGELRSLDTVVEVLEKHGAKARDVLDIFGKKGGPGMTALLAKGHGALRKTADSLREVGTAARFTKERIESAGGAFDDFHHSIDDLTETLGKSGVMKEVVEMTKGLTRLVRATDELDPGTQKMIVHWLAAAAALGPLVWLGGKAAWAWGKFAAAAEWVGTALIPVAAALEAPLELIAALALALPALVIYWDDVTAALDRFVKKHESVKAALNWVNEHLFFGKKDLFGHVPTAGDKAKFESWLPMDQSKKQRFDSFLPQGPDLGRQALNSVRGIAPGSTLPGEAKLTVEFNNAPKGTTAKVSGARGISVGVDMGYAMHD